MHGSLFSDEEREREKYRVRGRASLKRQREWEGFVKKIERVRGFQQ